MKTKNILMVIAIIVVIALIGTVGLGYYKKATTEVKNPIVTMEIQDFGTIKLELYPEMAPNTVKNFVALANNGFYNGLTFHRVIKDFMIQGGDPEGAGTGGATLSSINKEIQKDSDEDKEYSIKGEFAKNGFKKNTLSHEKGVISMARSDYSSVSSSLAEEGYNSGSSQFFIMTEDNKTLDKQYAAFGKVIEGMEVVEKIAAVEIDTSEDATSSDKPVNPPVITSMQVETFGIDYGMPETQEPFDYTSWMMKQYSSSTTTK